jgi:predicted PurR-regulated permease PerM
MNQYFGNDDHLRKDIVFTFALALACYLAWLVRDVLVLLYVSGLFAVVLTPLVNYVSELRVGRWQPFKGRAILVLLVAVAGALTAFGFLALPPVIRDLQGFGREMPARLPGLMEKLKNVPFADQVNTDAISTQIQQFASGAATYLLVSIGSWAGGLFTVIAGFVLTIYFILEGDHAYRWFLSFFQLESRERLDRTLRRAELRMGKWLLGQGSLMVILGVVSTIVYASLGVRYAYALGVLTGLLNIVPVLGAALSVALALLVAAVDSWGRVLGVAIFYFIYLQVENSYLTPRIMRNRVGLPGLAIFVALLLGSALEGVVGAMVSIPTAVLVAVLAEEYLANKEVA